jgi:hypothetical protein
MNVMKRDVWSNKWKRPILTTRDIVDRAIKRHGKKYDYSKIDFVNMKTKVVIGCLIHGDFLQTPDAHLRGQGCSKCKMEMLRETNTVTTEEFIARSKKIHGKKYDYSMVDYKHGKQPIVIVCKKHGEFSQRAADHLRGHGCPRCINIISDMEREFLDHMNVPDTKSNRQVCIKRKKVDGIEDNTVYEFLGDYWHGNPQRFNHGDINHHVKKTFGQLYTETVSRFEKLKDMGYNIRYVWEQNWKEWRRNRTTLLPVKTFEKGII